MIRYIIGVNRDTVYKSYRCLAITDGAIAIVDFYIEYLLSNISLFSNVRIHNRGIDGKYVPISNFPLIIHNYDGVMEISNSLTFTMLGINKNNYNEVFVSNYNGKVFKILRSDLKSYSFTNKIDKLPTIDLENVKIVRGGDIYREGNLLYCFGKHPLTSGIGLNRFNVNVTFDRLCWGVIIEDKSKYNSGDIIRDKINNFPVKYCNCLYADFSLLYVKVNFPSNSNIHDMFRMSNILCIDLSDLSIRKLKRLFDVEIKSNNCRWISTGNLIITESQYREIKNILDTHTKLEVIRNCGNNIPGLVHKLQMIRITGKVFVINDKSN